MNQEATKPGTRKPKLEECEIGDFVYVGDDPFDAKLQDHRYIQCPAPRPHRTLSDELAAGMNFQEVFLPPPFMFKCEPWSNDGVDRFYVWRRVS